TAYFRIVMGGMIFNCIQMGINSAQRGAGNTKITMRTNLASNTVNVIFNYLLIGGKLGFPALGVEGAALATVLGTVVASVMSILSIFRKDCFVSIPYIVKNRILPGLSAFKSLVRVGYSVFFEQILMRVGFMATSIMAAKMGTASMAAHQVGMNIMGLSFSFGDGLQATAVALIGRSLGARDEALAKEYGRTCRIIGLGISFVLACVYFFGGHAIMSAFFEEPEIVKIGVDITRIIIIVVIFQVSQVIYMGCLRGAGDTGYTALASIISVTVIRTVFSYTFGYLLGFGINGVWMGILADQVSRFIFGSVRFKQGRWTKITI
ncbi:MAG: MATE family efflux transporter, partial [Lachnospiraceae bacterium]|nr:MATE family efflux transporter [Lachnospiraceae bacterium]